MARLAFIGLGANLGQRRQNIEAALTALDATRGVEVLAVSSLFETKPEGFESDHLFLNGVAAIELDDAMTPTSLMARLLDIEATLGRRRGHGMDRTVDLDLLWLEGVSGRYEGPPTVELPHPRLWERIFVLAPWCQLSPSLEIPATRTGTGGKATVCELLEALLARGMERPSMITAPRLLQERPGLLERVEDRSRTRIAQ